MLNLEEITALQKQLQSFVEKDLQGQRDKYLGEPADANCVLLDEAAILAQRAIQKLGKIIESFTPAI